MATTTRKRETVTQLRQKLIDALAGQVHTLHFADGAIGKASIDRMTASGVVITITALGGREIVAPTMIRDGLSNETIAALRADFRRAYKSAIELKPAGA